MRGGGYCARLTPSCDGKNVGISSVGLTAGRATSQCAEDITKEEMRRAVVQLKHGKADVDRMVKNGIDTASEWILKAYIAPCTAAQVPYGWVEIVSL